MLEDYPEIMTIGEAAEALRVSKITLKRWEKKGKIKPTRINARGDRRYTKKQILGIMGVDGGTVEEISNVEKKPQSEKPVIVEEENDLKFTY